MRTQQEHSCIWTIKWVLTRHWTLLELWFWTSNSPELWEVNAHCYKPPNLWHSDIAARVDKTKCNGLKWENANFKSQLYFLDVLSARRRSNLCPAELLKGVKTSTGSWAQPMLSKMSMLLWVLGVLCTGKSSMNTTLEEGDVADHKWKLKLPGLIQLLAGGSPGGCVEIRVSNTEGAAGRGDLWLPPLPRPAVLVQSLLGHHAQALAQTKHSTNMQIAVDFLLNWIFKINFCWTIVDLQCCVNFCCTAKWISYTYTYIHSFLDSFPI